MCQTRFQTHVLKSLPHAPRARTAIHFGETQGQFDVLLKGHARKEVERLKNHTDSAAAITRQLERVHLGKITALREDGAGGGAIQTRHEV